MARIDHKPTFNQLKEKLDKEHQETINKMLKIQDLLLCNPPKDKRFKKYDTKYLLKYIEIINNIQNTDYNEPYIRDSINNLYNKIFEHRRY